MRSKLEALIDEITAAGTPDDEGDLELFRQYRPVLVTLGEIGTRLLGMLDKLGLPAEHKFDFLLSLALRVAFKLEWSDDELLSRIRRAAPLVRASFELGRKGTSPSKVRIVRERIRQFRRRD